MRCATCSRENPADASFCAGCGARQGPGCPDCGRENAPDARFCNGCGRRLDAASEERLPRDYTPRHLAERILRQKSVLEGERKEVTVLFVDVRRSMDLQEGLDPEEWHGVMDGFFRLLTEGVHRFEGTVNQYTGDGAMAIFGAPLAHEDHAQRACYAALHLRDASRGYAEQLKRERGIGFATRIGLNSGPVVVGKIGDDLRMDYTAQGHTVGLAARMEQLADPGSIYVSEPLARLAEGYFELRDLGEFRVRGASEPLRVHELVGPGPLRGRFDLSRARGLSRFVGRGSELSLLEQVLERVRGGDGGVVGVVAEAGVGKSRLCFEFVERARARGVPVYEGHAVAHGRSVPLVPIRSLVESYFGIGPRDSDEEIRRKLAGTLVLLDDSLRSELPLLFDLMGVAEPGAEPPVADPAVRRRRLREFIKRLLRARSQREPAVLFLEDLHWMDEASAGFVADLVDTASSTRTLVLANFRPEFQADWMGRASYQQIALPPLADDATRELLAEWLGDDPSLAGLPERIQERTQGNPLFVEETVLDLMESGVLEGERGATRLTRPVEAIEVPGRVQTLLAARIDRLSEPGKALLQTAAVIGHSFGLSTLRRVSGLAPDALVETMRELVSRELVYEEALYPDVEYAFKHPLTRDVAYEGLLTGRRRELHAAVARAIEEPDRSRAETQAPLLAHHWEAADDAERAAHWHRRAAEWIGGTNITESLRHWRRALAFADRDPEGLAEIGFAARLQLLDNGWRVGFDPEETQAIYTQARQQAEAAGDPRAMAAVLNAYWSVVWNRGDANSAGVLGREAVRYAREAGDEPLEILLRLRLAINGLGVGDYPGILRELDALLPRARTRDAEIWQLVGYDMEAMIQGCRAQGLSSLGRLEDAERAMARVFELARERERPELLPYGEIIAAYVAGERGAQDAVAHAQRALALAEEADHLLFVQAAVVALGQVRLLRGELDAIGPLAQRAQEIVRDAGVGAGGRDIAVRLQALAALERGEARAALAVLDREIEDAAACGRWVAEIAARVARVRARIALEGAASADELARELDAQEARAEELGVRLVDSQFDVARAELARARGDEAGFRAAAEAALAPLRRIGARGRLAYLERILGLEPEG